MHGKVTICSNILWTITKFRKDLILALIKAGYEVSVIGSNESFSENLYFDLKELNVSVIVLPMDRTNRNLFRELLYFFKLYKTIKKIEPAIVLHFSVKPNIYGSIACMILKIPFINTINGLGSGIIHRSLTSIILKVLYSVSLKTSCKVLFQNEDDKNYFLDRKLIKKEKAGYVPGSGINTSEYYLPIRKPNVKKSFLFVSRLLKDKGLYEYINVVRVLKKDLIYDVEFLVAGIIDESNPSGVSREEILEWQDENLIRFLGKTDNIKDFFNLTDFIVLPSYREGLSRLLLEAASCQKVIITSDVPGCKEIVKNGYNGFLCNARDTISLRNVIEKAIKLNDKEYFDYAANSRKLVIDNFTDEIVNKIYLTEIFKVLSVK